MGTSSAFNPSTSGFAPGQASTSTQSSFNRASHAFQNASTSARESWMPSWLMAAVAASSTPQFFRAYDNTIGTHSDEKKKKRSVSYCYYLPTYLRIFNTACCYSCNRRHYTRTSNPKEKAYLIHAIRGCGASNPTADASFLRNSAG